MDGSGGRENPQVNVFGEPLATCSDSPKTGWYRSGCCETDAQDSSGLRAGFTQLYDLEVPNSGSAPVCSTHRFEFRVDGEVSDERDSVCGGRVG